MAAGHFQAITNVIDDDARALLRLKRVVDVGPVELVFHKKLRVKRFASIVVQGANAREHGVGANALGGLLSQVRYLQAVLVRAGGAAQDVAQQRMIRPRELDQLQAGGYVEHIAQGEEAGQGQRGRQGAVDNGGAQKLQQAQRVEADRKSTRLN